MAIFHCAIKIIKRSAAKSAVAAAAYRSASLFRSEYDGRVFDYTRKTGVLHTEILLPPQAPREYLDRSTLWNAVEKIEKAKNSQLAREVEISLPTELTWEQNLSLAREYARRAFVEAGMCADLCFHDKGDGNPHCHILLTLRPINEDGTWGLKQKKQYEFDESGNKIYDPKTRQYKCRAVDTTDWRDRGKAEVWRESWAALVNEYLKQSGHDARVDHRSYARQGVEKIPQVHMGAAAMQMEKRGIETERGDLNRQIAFSNSEMRQLRARIIKTETWLTEQRGKMPPTLADTLAAILNPDAGRSRLKQIADLKLAARTLVFIQENHITDLPALADKVSAMLRGYDEANTQIKKLERRQKTLDKHLEQCENFRKCRKVNARYESLYAEYESAKKETGLFAKAKADRALKAAQDYYRDHEAEIRMFEAAEKYLKDVLQKRFDPAKLPVKKWSDERAAGARELDRLYAACRALKEEIKHAETLKRFAAGLMVPDEEAEQTRRQEKTKTQEETR